MGVAHHLLTVRTEGKSDDCNVGGVGKVERKALLTAVTEAPVSINIEVSWSCIEPVIERLAEGNLTLESIVLMCELCCSLFSPAMCDSAKVGVQETVCPRNLKSALWVENPPETGRLTE